MFTAQEVQWRPESLRVIVSILINNVKAAGVHTHGAGEGKSS